MISVIDCTLRDGGNYNRWQFSDRQVAALVSLLDEAGTTAIEVGYVGGSGSNRAADVGPTADVTPAFLARLPHVEQATIAVQAVASVCPTERLDALRDSVVGLIRVATYPWDIDASVPVIEHLAGRGHRVSLNVMASSYVDVDTVGVMAHRAESAGAALFYLADSFGSLVPDGVSARVSRAVEASQGMAIGFHAHNNLGLAFANTIAAVDAGAQWVDGSLAGLARGAGNLPTEQLLSVASRWDAFAIGQVDVSAALRAAALVTDEILEAPLSVSHVEIETGLDDLHYYFHPIVEEAAARHRVEPAELRAQLRLLEPRKVDAEIVDVAALQVLARPS